MPSTDIASVYLVLSDILPLHLESTSTHMEEVVPESSLRNGTHAYP